MARRKRRRVSSRRRHSLAAKRGWRKSARKGRRGGRRRRRNPGYGYNGRRRYRRNPSGMGGILKAPLSAFNRPDITEGALISGGAFLSGLVSSAINNQIVSRFMPSMIGNKIAQGVVGLASAGIVRGLAGVASATRPYAGKLGLGGVVKVVSDVSSDLGYTLFSGLGGLLDFATESQAAQATRVLSDFATESGAASARQLGGMEGSEQF